MSLPAQIAAEAQRLSTDKLVKLYELDTRPLGGELFRFVSSIDAVLAVDTITHSGSVATLTTTENHTLTDGDAIRVTGAEQPEYNGDFSVTVVSPTTLTFNLLSMPDSNATGLYLGAISLNNELSFDGVKYVPVTMSADGFEWSGQGTLPTPTLQISNVNKIMSNSVNTLRDIVGATFTRTRTFRKHLDNGTDPSGAMIFPREVYRVNRKVRHNKIFIEWELASVLDQEGVMFPGRQCFRNTCTQRYRQWNPETDTFDYSQATCPYVGNTFFDVNNNVTGNAAEDRCGKQLSSCKLRFGSDPLPTRAVPGIGGR